MNNDISIGIPFCTEDVIKTIGGLLRQEYPGKKEIIAAYDNPGVPLDKKIASFIKKNKIKLIINKNNLGLAATYNVLIRAAKYDKVYLIHEDCVPAEKTLIKNSITALKKDPDSVVNATTVYVPFWRDYDFWNKIYIYPHKGKKSPALAKASLFNKSTFKKIGFFDEDSFRTAGEDMDFGLRMDLGEIKYRVIPDLVMHNHKSKKSSFIKVLRKEWQMGEAHGTFKRKYPTKRVGKFDLEVRVLFLLLAFLGLFYWPLFLLGISPFIIITLVRAIKGYLDNKWFIGLLIYPPLGVIILITQTIAGIKGFITKKQESRYYDQKNRGIYK